MSWMMAAAVCAAAVLGGMRTVYGKDRWDGKTIMFTKVWTRKLLYGAAAAWLACLVAAWLLAGRSAKAVRITDLVLTYGMLALVDGRRREVPDAVIFCFLIAQFFLALQEQQAAGFMQTLITGAVFFAVLLLFALLSRNKIGMGDVKLLGATAVTAGWFYTFRLLFLSLFPALVYSVWLLAFRRKSLKTEMPFVPFLFAAMVLQLVTGL